MSDQHLAPLYTWLVAPLGNDVHDAIERLRRAPDVQHVAVMPDVHLAADVCVGLAIGTTRLIYPQAVGGDIGCGILAVPFDISADRLTDPAAAARVLAGFSRAVPARRWNRKSVNTPPAEISGASLSHPQLDALWRREGTLEFATLGSGNHFAELQADGDGRLWLMVHSGSRAMGPAIRDHHLVLSEAVGSGLRALDAQCAQGRAYLHDAAWAQRFAAANRNQIAANINAVMADTVHATLQWEQALTSDHNHVALEHHGATELWVHRKGAMRAGADEWGVLPGSMGAVSFHVQGRVARKLSVPVPTAQAGYSAALKLAAT